MSATHVEVCTPRDDAGLTTLFEMASHIGGDEQLNSARRCIGSWYKIFLRRFDQEPPIDGASAHEQLAAFEIFLSIQHPKLLRYAQEREILLPALYDWYRNHIPRKLADPNIFANYGISATAPQKT